MIQQPLHCMPSHCFITLCFLNNLPVASSFHFSLSSSCFCGQFITLMTVFCLSAAQIQRSLVRNNQTQRFSQRQALRLHQGLVTSTAEQVALISVLSPRHMIISVLCVFVTLPRLSVSKVMERLCVRVQQQVCVLRGVGEMEEIQAAKQVLKEARNSRAVSDVKSVSVVFALLSDRNLILFFLISFFQAVPVPV